MGDKKELQRFKEFAKSKINILDTNNFIPYPKIFKKKDEMARRYEKLKKRLKGGEITPKEKKELLITELSPEVKDGHITDGFNSGGYGWCLQNWGTKWGICEPHLVEGNNQLFYSFDTAWSPPNPIIFKMSEIFPKLIFKLEVGYEGEEGKDEYILKNGGSLE